MNVVPPGWVEWQLSYSGILLWLKLLSQCRIYTLATDIPIPNAILEDRLFQVQYVHARCCTLLQLAQQEKLLSLDSTHPVIPWDALEPLLQTSTVTQALGAIARTLDLRWCADSHPSQHLWQFTLHLSEVALAIYQEGSPWTAAGAVQLKQTQARLGLILILQRLLNSSLCGWLQRPAPQEL
jgi:hypothetical protein